MLDINGQELSEHDLVQILCEIVEVRDDAVRVRILNSEQELEVSTVAGDEVLGLHVSSELTKFEGAAPKCSVDPECTVNLGDFSNWPVDDEYRKTPAGIRASMLDVFDSRADGVKISAME